MIGQGPFQSIRSFLTARSSLSFNKLQLAGEKLGRPQRPTVVRTTLDEIDPLGYLSYYSSDLANARSLWRVNRAVHLPFLALELEDAHEVRGKET